MPVVQLDLELDSDDEELASSATWVVDPLSGTFRHKHSNVRVSPEKGIAIEGKEYTLSLKDIEVDRDREKLGSGACGVVQKGVIKTTGMPVAIKTIKVDDKAKRAQLLQEIKGLVVSDGCPNLVQCYGGYPSKEGNMVMVVLELMDRGSLADLKRWMKGTGVPAHHLASITSQIMGGLNHLHNKKLLHRDIKPENILHGASGQVKLTDFGIARDLDTTLAMAGTFVGTVTYMSPERCSGGDYTLISDIWSVGMVVYELACGAYPFVDLSTFPAIFEALMDKPEPRLAPEEYPAPLCDFVESCLQREESKRWDTPRLMDHEFVKTAEKPEQLGEWLQLIGSYKERMVQSLTQLCPALSDVMIVGGDRKYNCAVVTLQADRATGNLSRAALDVSAGAKTMAAAKEDPAWRKYIQDGIDQTNGSPAACQYSTWHIERFAILGKDLSVVQGESFTEAFMQKNHTAPWREVMDALYPPAPAAR